MFRKDKCSIAFCMTNTNIIALYIGTTRRLMADTELFVSCHFKKQGIDRKPFQLAPIIAEQFHFRLQKRIPPEQQLGCLIHTHETSWERPHTFVWVEATLNKQHLEFVAVKAKHHAVRRDGRMRVAVAEITFHNHVTSR